jgi:hypothetical protein
MWRAEYESDVLLAKPIKADLPVGINFDKEKGGPMVESFILCIVQGIGVVATIR